MEDNVRIMARPPRLELPGGLYHVTSGGNARNAIFHGKADHERFREQLDSQLNALEKGRVMR